MSRRSSGAAANVSASGRKRGKKNLPRVRNTVLAEQDLEEIWLYIAADNIVAADALLDKVAAKSTLLASNPELGRSRPEIHEGLRSFPVGNYILFYRPEAGGIELTRVLHGARDIDRQLLFQQAVEP